MKKEFVLLLLLTILAGTAHAQRNVSLGLKAGGTLSDLTGKQASGYESAFGFQAGGFLNVGLSRLFAFQPEVIYSRKGAKLATSPTVHARLDYVDVPLVFHINVDGLFFEAGPQVGFLVAAHDKVDTQQFDTKARYNTVDAGYIFGLGYQRKAGLGVGLRYNGGITNIEKSVLVGTTKVQNNIRNGAFQLYLTYSFQGN
ncbi:PorT family protein [Hymenobacter sp. BT186]|uniref:PorT family protein n=1 Tax=Hymenobacter telluris TaxID=2816474 RepID=A0A939F0D7_9BACT|nr:porin family protein [Hymenobacter telluris]MBO0359840.1 PorT family protein [Hymenobacter telluris]MBW3375867.1 PorT family protein [Hymenobacter norwichensis]